MAFGIVTDEEIAATLVRARASKSAKYAARKASTLRRDFLDADLWLDLAVSRGLTLPPWGEPCSISLMRTWGINVA